ncbi:Hypothetical protein, partial CDS, partial [Neorhizobium galegae bv. officinalis]
ERRCLVLQILRNGPEIHVPPDRIRIGVHFSPTRSVFDGKAALDFFHFERPWVSAVMFRRCFSIATSPADNRYRPGGPGFSTYSEPCRSYEISHLLLTTPSRLALNHPCCLIYEIPESKRPMPSPSVRPGFPSKVVMLTASRQVLRLAFKFPAIAFRIMKRRSNKSERRFTIQISNPR